MQSTCRRRRLGHTKDVEIKKITVVKGRSKEIKDLYVWHKRHGG
jgi:hypothetical protein